MVRSLSVEFWVPQFFRVPGAARRGGGDELKSNPPTAVAPFDDVHQPRFITRIGIVIDREQGSVIVECQFLGIAQTAGEDL